MLALLIDKEQIPLIIAIAVVLAMQYFLAVLAVSRLFKYKPKFGTDVMWHLIIQLLIVIGPIVFLLTCGKNLRKTTKEIKEIAAEEAAAKEEQEKQKENH